MIGRVRRGMAVVAMGVGMLMTAGAAYGGAEKLKIDQGALDQLGWKLGCQTYTFREMSAFETLDLLKTYGIHYCELYPGQRLSKEKGDLKVGPGMSAEDLAALKAKLAACGVTAVSFGVVPLPKDEAGSRKVFEFGKALGLQTIVSEPDETAFEMLDKLANEYGINVAIHDHPKPSHYWNPDTVLKVCQGRSKRIGSCADVGHWMRSGLDPLECVKKLEGRIIELHFKDIVPGTEGNSGYGDVPWGTGKMPLADILKELKRQGFKGEFSAEYERTKGQELIDNVAKSYEWFSQQATELAPKENALSDEEKAAGWALLFDGTTLDGWQHYRTGGTDGWAVQDGEMVCMTPGKGDMRTAKEYGNFELSLDFNIPIHGNSGVIYRCDESGKASWHTGVEMQILDNPAYAGQINDGQKCGGAYEIVPPYVDTYRGAGEWNHLRILANGPHVEHWLNGVLVAEYEQGSPEFKKIVSEQKFKDHPGFGTLMTGYIVLQDHGANARFRNIKVREIAAQR